MKLAYFTNTYPRATDTFIRREVIGLRKRGFDVKTYSVKKSGASHDVDEEVIQEKAQTTFILPANPAALLAHTIQLLFNQPRKFLKCLGLAFTCARPGIRGHLLQLAYFLEAIELAHYLKKDGIQHVHNHFGDNSGSVTLFASRLSGIPFSISIHGPHIFFDALYWSLDVKAKYARFIACIGHFCRSQLMLYTEQQDWEKFTIIRCGIDAQRFQYRPPSASKHQLLYVGRLDAEKGLPILFQSLNHLKSIGYDFRVVLLGDGADRATLEQQARDLGIFDMLDFRGFVDQDAIAQALIESDIFVLPSFAEGIPVSFMEAMAVGVPVVATRVAGVSELIEDEKTGLLAHASDPKSLASAIQRYFDEPELCQRVAMQGHEKVLSEFNIEDQVEKLAGLFKSIDNEAASH